MRVQGVAYPPGAVLACRVWDHLLKARWFKRWFKMWFKRWFSTSVCVIVPPAKSTRSEICKGGGFGLKVEG